MTIDQSETIRLLFHDRDGSWDEPRLRMLRCGLRPESCRGMSVVAAWDAMVAYIQEREQD